MPRGEGTPIGSALSTEASAWDSVWGTGVSAVPRRIPDAVFRGVDVVVVTRPPCDLRHSDGSTVAGGEASRIAPGVRLALGTRGAGSHAWMTTRLRSRPGTRRQPRRSDGSALRRHRARLHEAGVPGECLVEDVWGVPAVGGMLSPVQVVVQQGRGCFGRDGLLPQAGVLDPPVRRHGVRTSLGAAGICPSDNPLRAPGDYPNPGPGDSGSTCRRWPASA